MDTGKGKGRGSCRVKLVLAAMLVAASAFLAAAAAVAQQANTPPRPARAHEAVRSGQDCYRRGDYQTAAQFYQDAQANQQQLSPSEQAELAVLVKTNSMALQASREGAMHLSQAAEALQQGKLNEAMALVKAESANQYLLPADKARLAQLSTQLGLRSGPGAASGKALPPPDVSKEDYRTLVNMARTAYTNGDYEKAEFYAKQAEVKASRFSWNLPLMDSHGKVLQDVQTARGKLAAANNALKQSPGQEPKAEQPFTFTSGINKVKAMLMPGSSQTKPDQENPTVPKSESNVVSGPAANAPLQQVSHVVSKETLEARVLRDEAIKAITNNDLALAKKLAEQAKAKGDSNSWWDRPSPDELLKSINSHLAASGQGNPGAAGAWQPAGSGPPVDANNARARLKDARKLFAQGKLEDADRVCSQVGAVKISWGMFEDNPDKLRRDVQAARQRADKAEAGRVLADARKLLAAGNLAEARASAWKAKQLHGPYGLLDLGDRPDRVLADIDAAEAKAGKQGGAGQTMLAQKNQQAKGTSGGTMAGGQIPPPVPVAAMSAKAQADSLLQQSSDLLRQGNLLEAHARALEARAVSAQAIKAGLVYAPTDVTPDLFLLMVASQAKNRIEALVRTADDYASGAADAGRLKAAADHLGQARLLSAQFGLDSSFIEGRLVAVAQRQANPAAMMTSMSAGQGGGQGAQLLENARNEIRAGRLEQARKFAEEAFDPKYGVQDDARKVLASIDIESFEQKRLDAERACAAAFDAYQRKDFHKAQGILANTDEVLLSQAAKVRLREMAQDPAMQPRPAAESLRLAGGQIPVDEPGRAAVSDLPQPGGNAGLGVDFQTYHALNQVEFDQLTKEGLGVQRLAVQRAEAGEFDAAIEVLRGHASRLASSSLNPDQVATLKKSVDRYVHQYETLKAQREFQRQQSASFGDGRDRMKEQTRRQLENQTEIAAHMDRAGDHMRNGKFNEARIAYQRVMDLEPNNDAARTGIYMANVKAQEVHNDQIKRNKSEMTLYELDGNPGPYVDMVKPVVQDPRAITRNKDRQSPLFFKSALKDPVEQRLERSLREKKVTFAFDNMALDKCIKETQRYVGLNIVVDENALKEAGVRLEQPVTINLTDINLEAFLNHLLKKANLTFVIQHQAIVITTEQHAKGKGVMVVYPVADLVIPVENRRSPQGELVDARWRKSINDQLYGGSQGYGPPTPYGVFGSLPPGQPVGTATGGVPMNSMSGQGPKPNENMESLLIRVITSTIAPESWSDVGGKGTIQYFPLGMALVVAQQTPDIQEQIVNLLQALRRLQDLEVAIEMRLVSVSEAFYEFMGVDFDLNILHGGTRYEQELLSGQFAQPGFINQFRPSSFWSGLTPAGTFTPDLGVPIRPSSFDFAIPPFGGYPGTLGADGGISLGLAFLSDVQVKMFLQAAQGDRRTNTMQAPKITVFNGQTATINVGDELSFLDSINVIQVGGQTVFQPVQNRVPYGVFMTVTPVVSADRRFVRLNLAPQLQNLISATVPLLPVQQIVPQLFYDNVSPPQPAVFQLFFQQPSTSFITLNTTVVVPDGGTVLMGGLKTLVEARNEFGPPVLSKIPYLNRLFTNVGVGREAQSLMIMVTARIIINEEEEAEFLGIYPRIPR